MLWHRRETRRPTEKTKLNLRPGRNLPTRPIRLRATNWTVSNTLGYNYYYDYLNEHTGRVSYAQNTGDGTFERSYEYDNVGRLIVSHSGAEARAHVGLGAWGTMNGPYSLGFNYDQWGNMTDRYGWGGEVQLGSPGVSTDMPITYTAKNQRNNF